MLAGRWASQPIVVTGRLPDASLRDLTPQARFKSSHPKTAAVGNHGVLTPVADGEANIEIGVSV